MIGTPSTSAGPNQNASLSATSLLSSAAHGEFASDDHPGDRPMNRPAGGVWRLRNPDNPTVVTAEVQELLARMLAAESGYPFGPGAEVWKVGGKIFAIVSEDSEPVEISLKCDPELALDLREEFPNQVKPGYHLNKRHWNTVVVDQLPDGELDDWIRHSYDLVVASLPIRIRQGILEPYTNRLKRKTCAQH